MSSALVLRKPGWDSDCPAETGASCLTAVTRPPARPALQICEVLVSMYLCMCQSLEAAADGREVV